MNIVFCDVKKYFTDACTKMITDPDNAELLDHYKFTVYLGDIRDLNYKNAAYISPANSFGSMGGGIDKLYDRVMFPNISKKVMETISKRTTVCKLDRAFDYLKVNDNQPYLPIGEAIITPLSDYPKYSTCHLITAPTMVLPDNIVGTDNPYQAFKACIQIAKENRIENLICPGLGTGVGGIICYEAARQMFQALADSI